MARPTRASGRMTHSPKAVTEPSPAAEDDLPPRAPEPDSLPAAIEEVVEPVRLRSAGLKSPVDLVQFHAALVSALERARSLHERVPAYHDHTLLTRLVDRLVWAEGLFRHLAGGDLTGVVADAGLLLSEIDAREVGWSRGSFVVPVPEWSVAEWVAGSDAGGGA